MLKRTITILKYLQFQLQCYNSLGFDFNSPTQLYFFVALDMYILYRTCF